MIKKFTGMLQDFARARALLVYSLAYLLLYWSAMPAAPVPIGSIVISYLLVVFGGLVVIRYFGTTYEIVILGRKMSDARHLNSHLAVYGVFLLALGSVISGCYQIAWNTAGQPAAWIGSATSAFGRSVTAIGFWLMLISPDLDLVRSRLPSRVTWIAGFVVAMLLAFFLGQSMPSN